MEVEYSRKTKTEEVRLKVRLDRREFTLLVTLAAGGGTYTVLDCSEDEWNDVLVRAGTLHGVASSGVPVVTGDLRVTMPDVSENSSDVESG